MVGFQPVSPWVGRLSLPRAQERTPDGRVWIELEGTSGRVPLVWRGSDALGADCDVRFNDVTEAAKRRGDKVPVRLEGWRAVKPLESIAGARDRDGMWVSLPAPRWDGQTLTVDAAPTEVSGPLRAQATIVGAQGGRLQAAVFDPSRQAFETPVWLDTAARAERTDLTRLVGASVWLYGEPTTGALPRITAVRPVDVLHTNADQVIVGAKACARAVDHLWDCIPAARNETHRILLDPRGDGAPLRPNRPLLAMHLFGGYRGPGGDPALPLGIAGGHFAFGVAEASSDGDLSLTYHQVYGQNPDEIVSGKVSWDAYTGSFERGWMYTRPIVDMLVEHPALQRRYDFGGGLTFCFFDVVNDELTRMEARYRVGDGDGVAVIDPRTNCSQDSANAIYAAVEQVLAIDDTVAVYPGEPQHDDFRALVDIARAIRGLYTPAGIPAAWEANANRTPIPVPGPLGRALQLVSSHRTVLPRTHQESLAKVLLAHGARIFIQVTSCVAPSSVVETPIVPTRLPI